MTVLLVEDTPSDVVLFQEGLKTCESHDKIILRVAGDGEHALKALFQEGYKPDLIILDINLPKMDGYEVLRRLKASTIQETPTIVFSSTPSWKEPPFADAYIQKPLYLEEYIETVRAICNEWLIW
jgi:CheY-like chemotaxis protein